jgi:hypothetical protein
MLKANLAEYAAFLSELPDYQPEAEEAEVVNEENQTSNQTEE